MEISNHDDPPGGKKRPRGTLEARNLHIYYYTLGCKVNQTETEAMRETLASRGHTTAAQGESCDAVVINTCTVTATSDQKSRQTIRKLRREHPDAVLAVCGCLSQTTDLSDWPEIDLLGGTGDRLGFAEKLENHTLSKDVPPVPSHFDRLPVSTPEGRSRAFLKLQDGCDNHCTYCIIPSARGASRSRPPDDALEQARLACARGCRELVLTGIEISSYKPSLEALVTAICAQHPSLRLRLGSLDPRSVGESLLGALAPLSNFCPHLHLSLQSGSDGVLRRMGRRYTARSVLESITLAREALPGCAVTGDLIAGFPGETEAEWAETLDFLDKAAFSALHIFPYSRRPGTPAAAMPGQLTRAEKQRRARQAADRVAVSAQLYREAQIGRTLSVLFETAQQGLSENYLTIHVEGGGARREIAPVFITGTLNDGLTGRLSGEDARGRIDL